MLQELWLAPAGVTITAAALAVGCSRKRISSIINGRAAITRGHGAAADGMAQDDAGILAEDAGSV